MDTILQDVWYSLRQFARRPGFAAIAVLSLGIAAGANSLIYGLVDGLVLRPFPYPDPDRLIAVGVGFPRISGETNYVEVLSPAEYGDLRSVGAFASVAGFDLGNRNISGGDVPERVFTAILLDDLFPVIGMPAQLGRGFTRDELVPGGPAVAIISNRLWHTRFGGDPAQPRPPAVGDRQRGPGPCGVRAGADADLLELDPAGVPRAGAGPQPGGDADHGNPGSLPGAHVERARGG